MRNIALIFIRLGSFHQDCPAQALSSPAIFKQVIQVLHNQFSVSGVSVAPERCIFSIIAL